MADLLHPCHQRSGLRVGDLWPGLHPNRHRVDDGCTRQCADGGLCRRYPHQFDLSRSGLRSGSAHGRDRRWLRQCPLTGPAARQHPRGLPHGAVRAPPRGAQHSDGHAEGELAAHVQLSAFDGFHPDRATDRARSGNRLEDRRHDRGVRTADYFGRSRCRAVGSDGRAREDRRSHRRAVWHLAARQGAVRQPRLFARHRRCIRDTDRARILGEGGFGDRRRRDHGLLHHRERLSVSQCQGRADQHQPARSFPGPARRGPLSAS